MPSIRTGNLRRRRAEWRASRPPARRLSPATLARIAAGMAKFILQPSNPFLAMAGKAKGIAV